MIELERWAHSPGFGDDLELILDSIQRRITTASAFQDWDMHAHYSRLFERLQGVRSEYRQNLAAADWENASWEDDAAPTPHSHIEGSG